MTNGHYHNCQYCNQLVLDGDPYCAKCGGPQKYKPKGGGEALDLDPWCITDDAAKQQFQGDPKAVEALVNTWRHDPDHAHTIDIMNQINAALKQSALKRSSWYFCCPWSSVYDVQKDITIDGKHMRHGQQFTFDVSAEGMEHGKPFKREVLVGDFKPTEDVDYCLPGDNDHDEH